MPWSWTGVAKVSVSPLCTTQRARSLKTYGWTNRSTYNTPGTRASNGSAPLSTSTRTPPELPQEYLICVPPRIEAARTISGTRDASKAVISREMRVPVPDDGAAAAPPNDVCGPIVDPDADASNIGEKLEVAAPADAVTLFAGMPPPRVVTALPSRESPLRSRSISRRVITPYSSERRGLSLYAGWKTPLHRTTGRAAARSMAGPSARTMKALYAMYWRIVTPVEASIAFIAGVTGPLN